MDRHHSKLLLIFCLALALIGVLIAVNFYVSKPKQTGSGTVNPIRQTFADINPGPKTTTILAPNGKMSLIVKEEKVKDGITETFSTMAQDAQTPVQIYSETLPTGSSISVPYNTFSPDNKYVFLKRTGQSGTGFFVLKTDGTPFKSGPQSIDFLSLFNQKFSDITNPKDVTGWGGVNLIVVNAYNPDGKVNRSFWYDVTSNSFITLSTRFD